MIKKPLIFEIKGNSLDDGPGIRTAVFFKGCPLSCVWCHNPEGIETVEEISFDLKECIGCNTCLDICEVRALSRDNTHYIDREKCTLCFQCVESCPAGALTKVGRQFEVDEILDIVKKDIPFFETSRGGVTLTGGECTLFMPFTSDLLKQLKTNNIHTLIETCGHFDINRFCKLVLPFIDIIYFDIKLMDDIRHKKYCGITNKIVLQNFKELHAYCRSNSIQLLPRVPLIPGITTEKGNLLGIAAFLKQNSIDKVELLPYNPLWIEKAESLGKPLRYGEKNWMTRDAIEECKKIFMETGLNVCG